VDGGITDNLGLRAVTDVMSISADPARMYQGGRRPPRYVAVISVDAATASARDMDESDKEPSAVRVAGAVTNLQLTRYDVDSRLLIEAMLEKWAGKLAAPERPISTHLVTVSIQDVNEPSRLQFLNSAPTSFALKDDQVDGLIKEGRELLRNNPVFQELLTQISGQSKEQ
jgi:NTE family protein